MAPNPVVARITALLSSEAHERQIAAAIVLGEIGAREPAAIDALAAAVRGGIPPVAREIDRAATATLLRDEAARLRKRHQVASALTLLRALGRSPDATPADGFALAVGELAAGRRDEAPNICEQLVAAGFDLAGAGRSKVAKMAKAKLRSAGYSPAS